MFIMNDLSMYFYLILCYFIKDVRYSKAQKMLKFTFNPLSALLTYSIWNIFYG